MPVAGFLHRSDIKHPYALEKTARAKTCEVEVKKGIHLTAYVKDVFPNAGRLTLSLDPSMNRDKVRMGYAAIVIMTCLTNRCVERLTQHDQWEVEKCCSCSRYFRHDNSHAKDWADCGTRGVRATGGKPGGGTFCWR